MNSSFQSLIAIIEGLPYHLMNGVRHVQLEHVIVAIKQQPSEYPAEIPKA